MDGDLGERGDTAQQTSFRLNAYVVLVLVVFVVVLVGFSFLCWRILDFRKDTFLDVVCEPF